MAGGLARVGLGLLAEVRQVLVLGAHCDDIEIGCGGTLRQLVQARPGVRVTWLTLSSDPEREQETRRAASRLLEGVQAPSIAVESFRQSYFPYVGGAIKERFDRLAAECQPDVVFTHYRHDLHQDHRVVNELTWNTFRDHLILEYEIPKFDGDLGTPNAFVPLTRAELAAKCTLLEDCFASQRNRSWFSRSTFEGIARLRGIECQAPEGFAEAFYLRKTCLRF